MHDQAIPAPAVGGGALSDALRRAEHLESLSHQAVERMKFARSFDGAAPDPELDVAETLVASTLFAARGVVAALRRLGAARVVGSAPPARFDEATDGSTDTLSAPSERDAGDERVNAAKHHLELAALALRPEGAPPPSYDTLQVLQIDEAARDLLQAVGFEGTLVTTLSRSERSTIGEDPHGRLADLVRGAFATITGPRRLTHIEVQTASALLRDASRVLETLCAGDQPRPTPPEGER